VLDLRWAADSMAAGAWLPEAPYELQGDGYYRGGPAKGRARAAARGPGPFAGVCAHVPLWAGKNAAMRQYICNMLIYGGATMLEAPPQAAAMLGSRAGGDAAAGAADGAAPAGVAVVVGNDIGRKQYRELLSVWHHMPIQFNWVLDSVSAYTPLPRKPFAVKPGDVAGP